MKIPYGTSDFGDIRARGLFYVDKTPFLPVLERPESGYRHVLFLRPRRFGKSTLLSLLKNYYDIGRKEQFDKLFEGLWIHEHPTPERNTYLVLTLDFSGVATDGGHEALRRSFLDRVKERVFDFVFSHRDVAPDLQWLEGRIDGYESPESLLGGVFTAAGLSGHKLEFLSARPHLAGDETFGDRGRLFDLLEAYYDGYRFSPDATERVFNSDMVLYFLRELDDRGRCPDNMLDHNVRTEYRHLQRIGTIGGAHASERRELLETVLSERHIRSDLVPQFGVRHLPSRAPFASLLYYLGMLTLREAPRDVLGYDLEIPNRVIRELQWEHLALMLQDQEQITVRVDDLQAALGAMAVQGDIAPFLELFHTQVIQAFGVKDTRRLDERTIKLLFMTYVSLGRAFHPLSEKEFAQGYCDLFLGSSKNVASARYSWLLEFKYLQANAKPAWVEAAFAEAEAQVARYASDKELLPLLLDHRELKAGMIVFVGTKKALFRPWPPALGAKAPRAGRKAARPRRRKP